MILKLDILGNLNYKIISYSNNEHTEIEIYNILKNNPFTESDYYSDNQISTSIHFILNYGYHRLSDFYIIETNFTANLSDIRYNLAYHITMYNNLMNKVKIINRNIKIDSICT